MISAKDNERDLCGLFTGDQTTVGAKSMRENVERHTANLASLAENLRKLGIEGCEIDEHVTGIFDEYRRELSRNIQRICADAGRNPVN
jgi:hypothetical protein